LTFRPEDFTSTADKLVHALSDAGWTITPFGVEHYPTPVVEALQGVYDSTSLYVRTRPDYLATRGGAECYLLECKDCTRTADSTGNFSVEAIPWFIARHLQKINVRYLYVVDDPKLGMFLIRPDRQPFCDLCKILVPKNHEIYFERQMMQTLHLNFPRVPFETVSLQPRPEASGDPFILVPRSWLTGMNEGSRSIDSFARYGWR